MIESVCRRDRKRQAKLYEYFRNDQLTVNTTAYKHGKVRWIAKVWFCSSCVSVDAFVIHLHIAIKYNSYSTDIVT